MDTYKITRYRSFQQYKPNIRNYTALSVSNVNIMAVGNTMACCGERHKLVGKASNIALISFIKRNLLFSK